MKISETDVRSALAAIADPDGSGDIVSSGRVKGLSCADGRVGFVLELKPGEAPQDFEPLRRRAETAVRALPGVERAVVVLTAHAAAPTGGAPAAGGTRGARIPAGGGAQDRPASPPPSGHGRLELPGVGALVAVASGKGGVGKSTIAANLACAMARQGKRVGLLDADVYGPSAPILFGLEGERPRLGPDKRVIPLEAFGVKVMSVGFIAASEQAMIWRGPIVTSTISELLGRVDWAPLDVLVIDLPPGTGDVQITLSQRAPLTGAVIVSTPQKLALADVRRGIEMFAKVHVPILGVIENMSAARDPATGALFAPFGMDGARLAAEALGAPFLGAIPLNPEIAYASDQGLPPAAAEPDSAAGRQLATIAQAVLAAVEAGPRRPAPEIIFE